MRPLLLLALAACAPRATPPAAPAPDLDVVRFEQLAPDVWMHTSLHDLPPWGVVPSNGLVVVTGATSILVDTAWDDAQTVQILDWAARALRRPVARAVFTHAHADKMGGVGAVRARGIPTFAHAASNAAAPGRGLVPAEHDLTFDDDARSADLAPLVVFFPGGAHTPDNVVVGVPGGVLFGGCMIRDAESTSLGNVADADVPHWADAAAAVVDAFPHATIVVPSHGPPGGRELLDLTLDLARRARE